MLVTGAALLALAGLQRHAYTYSPLPQAEMTAVYTDSVEETGEGDNGPLACSRRQNRDVLAYQVAGNEGSAPTSIRDRFGENRSTTSGVLSLRTAVIKRIRALWQFHSSSFQTIHRAQTQVYPALADGIYRESC